MPNTPRTVRSTITGDGRVLLDVRQGQMFSVNVIGSQILELIERGWDETHIAMEISQTYAADFDTVRADIQEFIDALRKHDLLGPSNSVDPR